jgi:hypothetical protein
MTISWTIGIVVGVVVVVRLEELEFFRCAMTPGFI